MRAGGRNGAEWVPDIGEIRADRVDPDERHVEHEAGDVRGRGDVEAPVGDQRDVERGAADVRAEDVRELHPLRERRHRSRQFAPRQILPEVSDA